MKIHCLYDELVDPKLLKPHAQNRNSHPDAQIDRLVRVLQYQGIRHAIKVSRQSGAITSGHGRRLAYIKAGVERVPVVYQDYDDAAQEYGDVIADNALALWAELDLAAINMDMSDIKIDVELLGMENFSLGKVEEAPLPDLATGDPDFQQVTFTLSNEQKDILDEAIAKAKAEEDCSDEINPNSNGNVLAAILKRYVHG